MELGFVGGLPNAGVQRGAPVASPACVRAREQIPAAPLRTFHAGPAEPMVCGELGLSFASPASQPLPLQMRAGAEAPKPGPGTPQGKPSTGNAGSTGSQGASSSSSSNAGPGPIGRKPNPLDQLREFFQRFMQDRNPFKLGFKGKPDVVCTTTIIADLAGQIAGDDLKILGLIRPGVDPHIYEPVPRDTVAIEQATLILYNGYALESALIKLINASGTQAAKKAVGEVCPPLRALEEGARVPDPHVWMDVKNGIRMTNAIAAALVAVFPQFADRFKARAARLTAVLESLDKWIRAQVGSIPEKNRQLVTTHDAFQYYTAAYGFKHHSLIGISTEEQPSAATVRELVTTIRETAVPAIFMESTLNPQLIGMVANESKTRLSKRGLYSDSLGPRNGEADTYIKMMVCNTRVLTTELGGKCAPFVIPKA